MVTNAVKNQVVTSLSFSEILFHVVNDLISPDGSNQVRLSRTANTGYVCAERLGDLHGERADASARTINEDVLPRLKLSFVAKTLERGEPRNRQRSCLLKRYLLRLDDECRFGSARILG